MTNDNEELKSKQLLRGSINYLPWVKRTTLKLLKLKIITITKTDNSEASSFQWSISEDDLLNATSIILDSVVDDINCTINILDGPEMILNKLNNAYGAQHLDIGELKAELRSMWFDPSIEATIIFAKYDKKRELLFSAGGEVTEAEEVGIFVDGLKHKFWFNCRGYIRETGISTFTSETIRTKIAKHWAAWGGPEYAKQSRKSNDNFQANHATWTPRLCEKCKSDRPEVMTKDGKRKLYETHNTDYCKANKTFSKYLRPLNALDTGANRHFSKNKPNNSQTIVQRVTAAGGSTHSVVGVGTKEIGKLKLNDVYHVPDFTHNLVSAGIIMKEGKDIILSENRFQVFEGGKVHYEGGKILANGFLDENSDV
ncbi:hypothetical protein HDV02_000401 [Globomyces sp. JEL0801]|nr:hypothetical protein HDV02_000401 [Globomyces sp. JEL0801]